MRGETVTMSKAVYRGTDALVTGLFLTMAALLIWYPHNVMLAVPHSVYDLPPCPTEDHGLPGGCVFQGSEGDTFVIYTPGRV